MYKFLRYIFCFALITIVLRVQGVNYIRSDSDSLSKAKKAKSAKNQVKQNKTHSSSSSTSGLEIRPLIGLGAGMMSYIGNVKPFGISSIQNPMMGRPGFDLTISQPLSPFTEFSLYGLYGSVSVNERTVNAVNWDFQSTIAGGGIHLFFKILPKEQITPYVMIGIESFEFLSKADLYDQYGNEYYFWSDGTIRSLPQNSSSAGQATILEQSYNYQTDIRSLNLDNTGNYNQQTFALPVGVGFMFHLGNKADFIIGTSLHYLFTDHIDGLTPQVEGTNRGSLSHDMFMLTSVGLQINLTKESHGSKENRYDNVNFDKELVEDTVSTTNAKEGVVNDSAELQQYKHYMDTTGEFEKEEAGKNNVQPANSVPPVTRAQPQPTPSVQPAPPAKPASPPQPAPLPQPAVTAKPNAPATSSKITSSENTGNVIPGKVVNPANPVSTEVNNANVVYKVQLMSTKQKLNPGITFAGITDRAAETFVNGTYLYTTGNYSSLSDAKNYLSQLRDFGYKDAFIKPFRNGKPITFSEAAGGLPVQPITRNEPSHAPVAQPAPAPTVAPMNNNTSVTKNNNPSLIFRIQFGVFKVTPDKTFMNKFNQFDNPATIQDKEGLTHYMIGYYSDLNQANAVQEKAKAMGINAFIMPFYNNVRISMDKARVLMNQKQ